MLKTIVTDRSVSKAEGKQYCLPLQLILTVSWF